tara:strand:- start:1047 stop:1658 length:612 start_codon:yes stop_codon:yes gene_type:complete
MLIQISLGPMKNLAYIISDNETKKAAIVDPAWEIEKILDITKRNNLNIIYIINTHSHSDHISGNEEIIKQTNAKLISYYKSPRKPDIPVSENDEITLGKTKMKFIHTPGHCPDSICIIVNNKILTGDTLFVGDCGRIDLPGGNIDELYTSLFTKIYKLDDKLEVYPGHDYGEKPFSTIEYEKKHNYVLEPRNLNEFREFMSTP